MRLEDDDNIIAVFDIGGTWFRWGLYDPSHGLIESWRVPAINYLSRPDLTAEALQTALVDFIIRCVTEIRVQKHHGLGAVSVSLGAPINAHDMMVLGSGPLWGSTATPFDLYSSLHEKSPETHWHIINDVTALLSPYMQDGGPHRKSMLITVSSGVGSRLYDHRNSRIPYDERFGVQGEVGHLTVSFELDNKMMHRYCECGGLNHMNAFSSGRGLCRTLLDLPSLMRSDSILISDDAECWQRADDNYRLQRFQRQLDKSNPLAIQILDATVMPLSRLLATALCLDPEIDRVIITGGMAQGLGKHYRLALERTFLREGLYQITQYDPDYLIRRLLWDADDGLSGLKGAGIHAMKVASRSIPENSRGISYDELRDIVN